MNVIIVTTSLTKDMNSKTDLYRANAIRVLCRITDGTFLTQIDRYFKQAIVDKNPVVASAALVSGIHVLQVAMTHPMAVTNCNIDMESLLSDQNSSAITTLLKTGNESSVDRLMKQITNFMSDIADEFKIVLVEAIRSLCLKFPLKYRSLMNFLSNILREEGGFDYNKSIIDSIVILIRDIPDAKESGLLHLCEFIEDCEFTYLSTQILHFLGIEGLKTSDPSKYIWYIYNQVILENATVWASAVSTLAKFGCIVDSLKVRDRATLYLNMLGGEGAVVEADQDVKDFLFGSLDVPLINLETSLKNYVQEPSEEPFDIDSVPKEVKSQPLAEKKAPGKKPTGLGAALAGPTSTIDAYEKMLSSIPEFSSFGKLFKSSPPVELTGAETEYAVNVVKHSFDSYVLFQYNCTNTIPEQLLENVFVIVDASEAEEFSEVSTKPLRSLPYDSPGQTFVAFEKPDGVPVGGKFSNTLKFVVKEVDPTTGDADEDGVDDEYQLEDLEGTEVVPPNSRSHTCLLSGVYMGNLKVLVRLSFDIDGPKEDRFIFIRTKRSFILLLS
ncbi:hypothetical protein RHMOL_Rhmol02G0098000 [Rhododendron molle]|uniref:Uncharacterized protein n=1 Tax=Rhododendron molle TaxID=49168 RepID=A0ACC0PQ57_RHOML|nr:hypothetical protein RHMOL_Rhmol02G0098000 [Rhododendron molle]